MAAEKWQKVKFTGKRTGMEAAKVHNVGIVEAGDTIAVPADDAERWATLLPMADGKEGSDWTTVGEAYVPEDVTVEALEQREDHIPDNEVDEEANTAEEDAAELAATAEANAAEAAKVAEKSTSKK